MISENLQRLQDSQERIELNIASAYSKCEEKGAALPTVQNSDSLVETIGSIEQSSSGWKPQEDWWDIDRILAEDTEDYPAKIICLLDDSESVSSLYGMNAAKIRTSDGTVYETVGDSISHEWDITKDKACSLGYKTRYVIYYYASENVNFSRNFNVNSLYIIFKNVRGVVINRTPFMGLKNLEYVKLLNSTLLIGECTYYQCQSLVKIPSFSINSNVSSLDSTFNLSNEKIIDLSHNENMDKINNFMNTFYGCKARKIILFPTGNIKNFFSTFSGMPFLYSINAVDFASATDVRRVFLECVRLRNIDSVSNIKISGIDLKDCVLLNVETLLRFIDALQDFSADTEGTHTIVLGAANLAKLTEEEIAIATNKNWTMS